jgi:hypothetical protein
VAREHVGCDEPVRAGADDDDVRIAHERTDTTLENAT